MAAIWGTFTMGKVSHSDFIKSSHMELKWPNFTPSFWDTFPMVKVSQFYPGSQGAQPEHFTQAGEPLTGLDEVNLGVESEWDTFPIEKVSQFGEVNLGVFGLDRGGFDGVRMGHFSHGESGPI